MSEFINTKKTRLSVATEEIKKLKICSKKYLNDKYGWNTVKLLKEKNELGFTKYMVYNIKSLFKIPKSIKELSRIFGIGRDMVTYTLTKLIEEEIIESYHVDGSEKYYFLKGVNIDVKSLYMSNTKKEILTLLKINPMESKEIVSILKINIHTLLSALNQLKKDGILNSFNSVGGTNNKFFWFMKKNFIHERLACILAIHMEEVIKIIDDNPVRLKILIEKTGMPKGTLLHKIRRLMKLDIVKRFQNGRYFVYYLSSHQLNSAKIESLSSRQKFIYDLLKNNSYYVLKIRDLCNFKNDEGYRVRNAIKILLKFNLIKEVGDEIYTAKHFTVIKGRTIYNDLMEYFEKVRNFKIYCNDKTIVSIFDELFDTKPLDIKNKKTLECLILSCISLDSMIIYNFIINDSNKYISESEFTKEMLKYVFRLVEDDVLNYMYKDEERYYYLTYNYELFFEKWFIGKKIYYNAIINAYRNDNNYKKIPFMEKVLDKINELESFYSN